MKRSKAPARVKAPDTLAAAMGALQSTLNHISAEAAEAAYESIEKRHRTEVDQHLAEGARFFPVSKERTIILGTARHVLPREDVLAAYRGGILFDPVELAPEGTPA